MKLKLTILAFFFLFGSCATSPTGRNQLMLISDSEINHMGKLSFEKMKKEKSIVYDRHQNSYVQCIVNRLTPHVHSGIKKWEVVIFRDDTANAFALPGGYIGVHTGMLKLAQNDAQLAAVIGHEIGHVIARHGAEKVSSALAAQMGLVSLQLMTSGEEKQNLYLFGAQLLTQFTILLPHGRSQESESDEIGVILMAKGGFHPAESINLWKNMTKNYGDSTPEFLSTHPSNANRIKNLTSLQSKAIPYFNNAIQFSCN